MRAILIAIMSVTLLSGCRSRAPVVNNDGGPFVVVTSRPSVRFSATHLTQEQISACAAFRRNHSLTREREFEEIMRVKALPIWEYQMSEGDITSLLGEPESRTRDGRTVTLAFVLERTQRHSVLLITFEGGFATRLQGAVTISAREPNQSPEPMPASARLPAGVSDLMIERVRPADVCRFVAGAAHL
jgi:hypothetical protein